METAKNEAVDNYLYIKEDNNIYEQVYFHEIAWIEANGQFCTVHCTTEKEYTFKKSLSQLEQELPLQFLRIRRDLIVRKEAIHKITLVENKIQIGNAFFKIGRTYRSSVVAAFKLLG